LDNSINIQVQLDQAALTKGIKAVLDHAQPIKWIKYFGIVLILASIILFVFVLQLKSYAPLQGIFVGVVFLFFSNIMAYFNVRRMQHDERIYEKTQYRFGLERIEIQAETFEGYLDWEQIMKVVETKSHFLLYQSKLGASILPKTAFTDDEAADFRDLITTLPNLKHNIFED
jgi:hypothetical protein